MLTVEDVFVLYDDVDGDNDVVHDGDVHPFSDESNKLRIDTKQSCGKAHGQTSSCSVNGCAFELQVLSMNKLTGISCWCCFRCYAVLTSPKKDETAIYGGIFRLVPGSFSYQFADKFLFSVVHQLLGSLRYDTARRYYGFSGR